MTQQKTQSKKARKARGQAKEQASGGSGMGPMILMLLTFAMVAWVVHHWSLMPRKIEILGQTEWVASPLPLEMEGGDPYLRALMRTISAAESNTADPYRLLYGGKRVKDLSVHPDECVRIVSGPNKDDCTTAAGRYQFLTTTWQQEARRYHPERPAWYEVWERPSFEPEFQDDVMYGWLNDPEAWGFDIGEELRLGNLDLVLMRLSGTWTSLGYGIEDNSMTALLPRIYDDMLNEELAAELEREIERTRELEARSEE